MANLINGMLLLDITKEDVDRVDADKICGISKNTVAASLWDHPLIHSFLIQENNAAVEYHNDVRKKGDPNKYYGNIVYHLRKRASPLLIFLQDEIIHALFAEVSHCNEKEKAKFMVETIKPSFVIVSKVHIGKSSSITALPTFSTEFYINGLFQVWLLLYILAERENVPHEELRKTTFVLTSFLQRLMT